MAQQIVINIVANDMTSSGVSSAEKRLNGFEKAMNKAMKKFGGSSSSSPSKKIDITANDKASSVVSKVENKVRGFANKVWRGTVSVVDKATAPLRGIFNLLKNPLLTGAAAIGISIGLGSAVGQFAEFEYTMSRVGALSGTTGSALDALTEKAKNIGLTTKYTATEAAEAFSYMGMAGWKAKQMMSGIDGVMNLAAASGEDLATVSDIVTDDLTAFKMQASEAGHFADVLAAAATNSNTTVGLMGETFKYVGPLAGTMGYSIEDMAIAVGLMANSSIKGSQSGTALKNTISNMAAPTKKMQAAMSELGLSLTDGNGKAKTFRKVMDELRESYSGLGKADQVAKASQVFGKYGMSGMLAVINASEEDYNKLTKAIDNSEGAARKMAETMEDNLKGSFTKLSSAAQGTLNTLGERLAPHLRAVADWATNNMQYVERFISGVMDNVDGYINKAKEKISQFTQTEEWQNADIFGKAKIAWNEIIGDPFSEWWNTGGQGAVGKIANSIGSGMGTIFSTGLKGLLGIDIVSEGASIGGQFAKGFADNFKLGEIITTGIKQHPILSSLLGLKIGSSLFSSGKNLIGGLKGLFSKGTSLAGAAAETISAVSLMSITAGVVNLSGALTNGCSGLQGSVSPKRNTIVDQYGNPISSPKNSVGSNVTVSKAPKGKYVLYDKAKVELGSTNSVLMAGLARVGTSLGGNATTVGGMALQGAGSIAGGIGAGITLASAVKDLYKGYKSHKSGNDYDRDAYVAGAATKAAGVGAGALIGTAILPGVGTLIGAGIGGMVGSTLGNAVRDEKLENSWRELEKAKYASKDLQKAIMDSSVSAEEFQERFEKACSADMRKHFGDMTMSLQEIDKAARSIALGSKASDFEAYASAVADVASSSENLAKVQSSLSKSQWKLNNGVTFDSTESEELAQQIDQLTSGSEELRSDKQMEFQASVKLLLGDKGTKFKGYEGVNEMYTQMEKDIKNNTDILKQKYTGALKDGIIDQKEFADMKPYIDKIHANTDKFTQPEADAGNIVASHKFKSGNLSADTFEEFRGSIKENVDTGISQADEALKSTITGLQSAMKSGQINTAEYTQMLQAAFEGHDKQVNDLKLNGANFELDTFTDAYGKALDGCLPDLKGTTQEKLSKFLQNTDISDMDSSGIIKALGLDPSKTSKEVQENIGNILKGIQVDLDLTNMLNVDGDNPLKGLVDKLVSGNISESAQKEIAGVLEKIDMTDITSFLEKTDIQQMSAKDIVAKLGLEGLGAESSDLIAEQLKGVQMNMRLDDIFENMFSNFDGTWSDTVNKEIQSAFKDFDFSSITDLISNTNLSGLSAKDIVGKLGLKDLGPQAQEAIASSLQGIQLDLTKSGIQINGDIGSQISNQIVPNPIEIPFLVGDITGLPIIAPPINGSAIYDGDFPSSAPTVEGSANYSMGSYPTSAPTVNGKATYNGSFPTNSDVPILNGVVNYFANFIGGIGNSKGEKASGGFVNGATHYIVGEAGPEAIIPLSSARRKRGLDLWMQAGRQLGVGMFADGGIVGTSAEPIKPVTNSGGNGEQTVSISVGGMSPNIIINANNKEGITEQIKSQINNCTDELCAQIAVLIQRVFNNTPKTQGG